MHCGLCGTYINPNHAQRVVSPLGKLVLACHDGRTCEYKQDMPVLEPVVVPNHKKVRVNEMARKFCKPWK